MTAATRTALGANGGLAGSSGKNEFPPTKSLTIPLKVSSFGGGVSVEGVVAEPNESREGVPIGSGTEGLPRPSDPRACPPGMAAAAYLPGWAP